MSVANGVIKEWDEDNYISSHKTTDRDEIKPAPIHEESLGKYRSIYWIVQKVEKKISNQVVQSSKLLDVGREEKDFESFTLYSNTPDDHEDVRLYYEIVKT